MNLPTGHILSVGKIQNGIMTLTTNLHGTAYTKEIHVEKKPKVAIVEETPETEALAVTEEVA